MAYLQSKKHTFQDASPATGNGIALPVLGRDTLKVEIFGSAQNTARTITFYEKMSNGTLVLLSGVRRKDYSVGTSTSTLNEVWEFGISNAYEIVMDLTSITGGTVTVKGEIS